MTSTEATMRVRATPRPPLGGSTAVCGYVYDNGRACGEPMELDGDRYRCSGFHPRRTKVLRAPLEAYVLDEIRRCGDRERKRIGLLAGCGAWRPDLRWRARWGEDGRLVADAEDGSVIALDELDPTELAGRVVLRELALACVKRVTVRPTNEYERGKRRPHVAERTTISFRR